MSDRTAVLGSEAWFKELENRLDELVNRLADASSLMTRSAQAKQEIDRDLSVLQELVARIEDRLGRPAFDGEGARLDSFEPAVDYQDVPDFPGYRVGSDGSVWGSRSAGRGYGRTREWRQLKPYLVRPGPALTVSLYRDRTRHIVRVDELVILTFVGSCPEGSELSHENGNRFDNRRDNLCYVPCAKARATV